VKEFGEMFGDCIIFFESDDGEKEGDDVQSTYEIMVISTIITITKARDLRRKNHPSHLTLIIS